MSQPRILVSGATGFVGSHLLPLLLEEGLRVTALVRPESDISRLPAGVGHAPCSLLTGEGLTEALRGHDVLIHLAALLFGCHWQDYLRANVTAAQTVCRALEALGDDGPSRVVLISSQAATVPDSSANGSPDDAVPHPVSAYGWSKLMVERTFQSMFRGSLVILRPPIIYGSGDRGLLPVFRGVQHGFAVSPGWGREFPVSCAHADDVAQAICCAMKDGAHGVYHISDGERHTMDTFCLAIGQALGRSRTRVFHIPMPVMAVSSAVTTFAFALAGKVVRLRRAPNWNFDKYREAREDGWVCDSSRLSRELGFRPRMNLALGMRESVEGYRKLGWL